MSRGPIWDWRKIRRCRGPSKNEMSAPWPANLFSVVCITATFAKLHRRCRSDWLGVIGLLCLIGTPGRKSKGNRSHYLSVSMPPSQKIYALSWPTHFHRETNISDGVFGMHRGAGTVSYRARVGPEGFSVGKGVILRRLSAADQPTPLIESNGRSSLQILTRSFCPRMTDRISL